MGTFNSPGDFVFFEATLGVINENGASARAALGMMMAYNRTLVSTQMQLKDPAVYGQGNIPQVQILSFFVNPLFSVAGCTEIFVRLHSTIFFHDREGNVPPLREALD